MSEKIMTILEAREQKGIEKGIKEGIIIGVKKERIEMAKNLIRDGMGVELVVKYTKLTEKEIEEIKLQMND